MITLLPVGNFIIAVSVDQHLASKLMKQNFFAGNSDDSSDSVSNQCLVAAVDGIENDLGIRDRGSQKMQGFPEEWQAYSVN